MEEPACNPCLHLYFDPEPTHFSMSFSGNSWWDQDLNVSPTTPTQVVLITYATPCIWRNTACILGEKTHVREIFIVAPNKESAETDILTCLLNTNAYMHAKSLQSCPTRYDPMDCRPPDSSVHGILQAGILEWVAISSSSESTRPRD